MTTLDETAEPLTIDDAYKLIDRHIDAIAALQKAIAVLLAAQQRRMWLTAAGVGDVHLSAAEVRVARLLDSALTAADIAAELHVSFGTVKTQMMNIYKKLGVGGRRDAVAALKARAES